METILDFIFWNREWVIGSAALLVGLSAGRGWGAFTWRGNTRTRRKHKTVIIKLTDSTKIKEKNWHAIVRLNSFDYRIPPKFRGKKGDALTIAICCGNKLCQSHVDQAARQVNSWERAYDCKLKVSMPKKVKDLWPV